MVRLLKRNRRKTRVKDVSQALSRFSAIQVPRPQRGNTTDPDSRRLTQARTGGYVQGHRILRVADANGGLILGTTVATESGESRGLPRIVRRVMLRLGYSCDQPELRFQVGFQATGDLINILWRNRMHHVLGMSP